MKRQNPRLVKFARQLRTEMTDAEKRLWKCLRSRQVNQYKFRRQYLIGKFIVDFVCLKERLIIEIDGGQHAETALRDQQRDAQLEKRGFTVLRFWNNDVLKNTEGVMERITHTLRGLER